MAAPKRRNEDKRREDVKFFDYYAAFAHAFVSRVLTDQQAGAETVLLDPWNGRGTTTTVAAELGVTAFGFDLNPAMVSIAEARLVSKDLASCAIETLKRRRPILKIGELKGNGIEGWLISKSVAGYVGVKEQLLAVAQEICRRRAIADSVVARRLTSFLLTGLASTLRSTLKKNQGSNPTWTRESFPAQQRLRPSIEATWGETLVALEAALDALPQIEEKSAARVKIERGDSRNLPLEQAAVDLVVTSPPYCTRIDYAVATRPELAILGDGGDFQRLRESLIGTTTVSLRKAFDPPSSWGSLCLQTLAAIRQHSSKASATYYYRNFLQYFDALCESLTEINRILKPGGVVALVVQDSYYKDIWIDLATIVTQMGTNLKWGLAGREDHHQKATLAASNPRARVYREDFGATESVLYLEKSETT